MKNTKQSQDNTTINLTSDTIDQIALKISSELSKENCLKLIKQIQNKLNQTQAKIYYAGHLDESKKTRILTFIQQTSNNNYDAEFIEDPSLIGGLKIVYNDYIFDSSLSSELNKGNK